MRDLDRLVKFVIQEVLPPGCGRDDIVWKPVNIEAKVLAVTLRLEE